MFDKIKSWCRHSLTVAWAYVLVGAGAALEAAPTVLDVLNAPELSNFAGHVPHGIGVYTAALGLVTFLARLRSLRRVG